MDVLPLFEGIADEGLERSERCDAGSAQFVW